MSKYKKSLDRVKKNTDTRDWSKEDWEHYQTICDALENQIPKKPLISDKTLRHKCPVCNLSFFRLDTDYCDNCGQALDWSDEE